MEPIPRKLYYKIGEVCDLCEIEPHVLRYWETEFSQLSPSKNNSGQRVYRYRDVQVVQRIKQLLYQEGYTIAGANKKLVSERFDGEPSSEAISETAPSREPGEVKPVLRTGLFEDSGHEIPSKERGERLSAGALVEEIRSDLKSILEILK
ncbi:MAG TPA: MerR family transcriptional regulator [Acidobacteriota bacterium]|jgi:DNA-binding transcriptional MerR regulator|nr:MerR family transcriptional regulator [Acidobacteriota bacterium]